MSTVLLVLTHRAGEGMDSETWETDMAHWYTNAPPERRSVYEAAIAASGVPAWVDAHNGQGRPDYIGLYPAEWMDLSKFWAEVRRLDGES